MFSHVKTLSVLHWFPQLCGIWDRGLSALLMCGSRILEVPSIIGILSHILVRGLLATAWVFLVLTTWWLLLLNSSKAFTVFFPVSFCGIFCLLIQYSGEARLLLQILLFFVCGGQSSIKRDTDVNTEHVLDSWELLISFHLPFPSMASVHSLCLVLFIHRA